MTDQTMPAVDFATIITIAAIFILFIIPIAISIFLIVRDKKLNDKVLQSSEKIKSLTELNSRVSFHQIRSVFNIVKRYDNKSNFNKIEPAYLMTADIRANLDFFTHILSSFNFS